jgi:GDP-D-mannose dehydratase
VGQLKTAIWSSFFLHFYDIASSSSLIRIVGETHPSEMYNPAAQSRVLVGYKTFTANGIPGITRPNVPTMELAASYWF